MTVSSAAGEPSIGRRRNVYRHVLDTLGLELVSGIREAGTALPTEPELSLELGVSRGALREAVKGLVAKGLLEIGPRTGTRVRPRQDWNVLDPDVLRWLAEADAPGLLTNLTALRAAIEPGAAELAARCATSEDVAALEAAFTAMQAAPAGDVAAFVEADVAFHAALLRACHNELFISLGRAIEFVLTSSFSRSSTAPGAMAASIPQHGLILAAVVAGDPATASAASASLVRAARHDLEAVPSSRDRSDSGVGCVNRTEPG